MNSIELSQFNFRKENGVYIFDSAGIFTSNNSKLVISEGDDGYGTDNYGDVLYDETLVYTGDLIIDGDFSFSCEDAIGNLVTGYLVIEGNLTVSGSIFVGDWSFIRAKNIFCKNLILSGGSFEFRCRDLTVENGIVGFYGDDGAVFRADVKAKFLYIEDKYLQMYGSIDPFTLVIKLPDEDHYEDEECEISRCRKYFLPEVCDEDADESRVDREKLINALYEGREVLLSHAKSPYAEFLEAIDAILLTGESCIELDLSEKNLRHLPQELILKLSKIPGLKCLNLDDDSFENFDGVVGFTELEKLHLPDNFQITDKNISRFFMQNSLLQILHTKQYTFVRPNLLQDTIVLKQLGQANILSLEEVDSQYQLYNDGFYPRNASTTSPFEVLATRQEQWLFSGNKKISGDFIRSSVDTRLYSYYFGSQPAPAPAGNFLPNLIIDGDLHVDGTIDFSEFSAGFYVIVTGDVRCKNLLMQGSVRLVIRGNLYVENAIVGLWGSIGGLLITRGQVTAKFIINAYEFSMDFICKPNAVLIGQEDETSCNLDYKLKKHWLTDNDYEKVFVSEVMDDDQIDGVELLDRVKNGLPILQHLNT